MSFYEGQLKQQMLYTANFLYAFFFNLKLLLLQQIFPILMIKMFFSQIQQTPGPNFRKEGKSLSLLHFRMNKTMLYRKLYDPGDLENKVEVTEV